MPFDKSMDSADVTYNLAVKLEREGMPYTVTIYDLDGKVAYCNVKPECWHTSGVVLLETGSNKDIITVVNLNHFRAVEFLVEKKPVRIPGDVD